MVDDWVPRSLPTVASVSCHEIAILGGSIDGKILNDGYILDIRTHTLTQKNRLGGFKSSVDWLNTYKRISTNTLFALVIKQDRMREMIKYSRGDSQTTWLNIAIKLPND